MFFLCLCWEEWLAIWRSESYHQVGNLLGCVLRFSGEGATSKPKMCCVLESKPPSQIGVVEKMCVVI
jgi:hypothetical protein